MERARRPLLGLAVMAFLVSVWVLAVLFGGGWAMDSSAESRALSGSETMTHLDRGFDEVAAADEALAGERTEDAEQHLARGDEHLTRAEQALARERSRLGDASVEALADAIEQADRAREVRDAERAWQRSLAENRTALEQAGTTGERARVLVEAEASVDEGDRVADEHALVAERMRAFAQQHPLVAAYLPLPVDEQATERVASRNDAWARRLEDATVATAFTRAPEQRAAMDGAAQARLDAYNPTRLRTVFASFDEDGDEQLDPSEAVAFYRWIEANVSYRHDDEDATPEISGTPVGDGREGTDYQQSPLETYDERLGDCEDTSTLQLAFYEYWGEVAYLGLTNTQPGDGITHATTILRVEDPQDYPEPERGFHTYELDEDNEHGVEAGTYLIVDNTYSDTFGTISGGVEAGTFELLGIESLAESVQRSDDWRGPPRR